MFSTLPESQRALENSPSAGVASLLAHVALVAAAVAVTANAGLHREKHVTERAHFLHALVERAAKSPTQHAGVVRPARSYTPMPEDTPVPTAVPAPEVVVVDVDVSPALDEDSYLPRASDFGREFATRRNALGDRPHAGADGIFLASQVEKAVEQEDESPTVRYPEVMRKTGMQGEVYTEFVVDTTGHVDPKTLRIIRSPSFHFTDAVKDVIGDLRFKPAEVGGVKVPARVEFPFTFRLTDH
ncbi:MAG: energy transducer TonB [Gemmatimonadaceae bacterium]